MNDRDVNRVLAAIAGLLVLAGPRRTRALAGFLYGLLLSRAHGASRRMLEAEFVRLFEARNSVGRRVDELERQDSYGRLNRLVDTFGAIEPRVTLLERFVGGATLRLQESRLKELGLVRVPGRLELTDVEQARADALDDDTRRGVIRS